jgi:hypothetical protein
MKKSAAIPSIRISCRYDSEIFGVYQPMIGWKSKRVRTAAWGRPMRRRRIEGVAAAVPGC